MSKFLFLGQNLFPELEKDKMGSQDITSVWRSAVFFFNH